MMIEITSIFQPVGGTTDQPIDFFEFFGPLGFPAEQAVTYSCSVPFDVTDYMPNWLVEEHEKGNTNLIKFLQYYYDWLYCSSLSELYTENINQLQDIENLTDLTRQAIINSFIPQIDFDSVILSNDELIDLLKNFKRDILAKKGTPEGIALFFSKFFPEVESVTIQQNLLSYNITLSIDGTPKSESVYRQAYESFEKPVGIDYNLSLNFSAGSQYTERQDDSAIEERLANEAGFTLTAYEVPLIGNYYVYNMGDTASIGSTSGCSGSSHPRAIAGNTSDMPTFTHPNLVIEGVIGASFGSINIYEFLYMDYESSPNRGITSCK